MGAESNGAEAKEPTMKGCHVAPRPSIFRRARERAENAFWTAAIGLVLLARVKGK